MIALLLGAVLFVSMDGSQSWCLSGSFFTQCVLLDVLVCLISNIEVIVGDGAVLWIHHYEPPLSQTHHRLLLSIRMAILWPSTPYVLHFTSHFFKTFYFQLWLFLSFPPFSSSYCAFFPPFPTKCPHLLVLSFFPLLTFLLHKVYLSPCLWCVFFPSLRCSSLVLNPLPLLCWCFYQWSWNRLGRQRWVIRQMCMLCLIILSISSILFQSLRVSYCLPVTWLQMYNMLFDHLIHIIHHLILLIVLVVRCKKQNNTSWHHSAPSLSQCKFTYLMLSLPFFVIIFPVAK